MRPIVTTTYSPHPRYLVTAALCALLAAVFAWELVQNFTLATALFCVTALGLALWNGQAALNRVVVADQGLTIHTPLSQVQQMDFRQLVSVSAEGRLTPALTLIYHPQQPDGLLDLDAIRALHLPTLLDQEELQAQLQAKVPV